MGSRRNEDLMKKKRGWKRREERKKKWRQKLDVKPQMQRETRRIQRGRRLRRRKIHLNPRMIVLRKNLKDEVIRKRANLRRRERNPLRVKVKKTEKRKLRNTRSKIVMRMKRIQKRKRRHARNILRERMNLTVKMKVHARSLEKNQRGLRQRILIPIQMMRKRIERKRRRKRKNQVARNRKVRTKDPERNIKRKRNTKSIRRGRMTAIAVKAAMKKRSLREN